MEGANLARRVLLVAPTREEVTVRVSLGAAVAGLAMGGLLALGCVGLLTPSGETAAGREAAAEVERSMGLVDDPELIAYIRRIGARLAQRAERREIEYRFFVVDMQEPNAFALPGGFVYVSRGLLALANSEDELANAIGFGPRNLDRELELLVP